MFGAPDIRTYRGTPACNDVGSPQRFITLLHEVCLPCPAVDRPIIGPSNAWPTLVPSAMLAWRPLQRSQLPAVQPGRLLRQSHIQSTDSIWRPSRTPRRQLYIRRCMSLSISMKACIYVVLCCKIRMDIRSAQNDEA